MGSTVQISEEERSKRRKARQTPQRRAMEWRRRGAHTYEGVYGSTAKERISTAISSGRLRIAGVGIGGVGKGLSKGIGKDKWRA